jgi:hypothetical protein
VITGSEYQSRGQSVRVVTAWNGKSNPDLARLQALLPLVSTRPNGPRNVMIRRADGSSDVRPFRGLAKPKGGEAS